MLYEVITVGAAVRDEDAIPDLERAQRVVVGRLPHRHHGVERRVGGEHLEAPVDEVVTPTGIDNLGLISGALDHLDAANPKYAQKMRFLRHVQQMDDAVVRGWSGGASR